MAGRFRHEDVSAVPSGWKVRTVKHRDHRVRVAFPPGRKRVGSGRLVSILHPSGENPTCTMRSSNPAELMIMGANPPRKRMGEIRAVREKARRNPKWGIYVISRNDPANAWALRETQTSKKDANDLARYMRKTGSYKKVKVERLNRENPRETEAQEKARQAVDRWLAGMERGGHTASKKEIGEVYQQALRHYQSNPTQEFQFVSSNPRVEVVHGTNPPVEDIVEEFTGTPAEWIDVYNEPHIQRGRYAQLGPLIALYIKPVGGGQVRRIGAPESRSADWESYWGGDAPVIVTDSTARQLYFVGGAQDITEALEAFNPRDRGNGIVELGECRRIDYEGRKEHVADPDEDQWKHDHGEENGKLPTVLFDTNHKRLLYEGGDYRIEGPWIRN